VISLFLQKKKKKKEKEKEKKGYRTFGVAGFGRGELLLCAQRHTRKSYD
jgi:hypothetical protein